jgi:hypothetical protein
MIDIVLRIAKVVDTDCEESRERHVLLAAIHFGRRNPGLEAVYLE